MTKHITRNFNRDEFDPDAFINQACEEIKSACSGRKVFNLVSGGVDSTVVFALLNRALGPDRVFGLHVDTGLMRLNESAAILDYLKANGFDNLCIEDASADFLAALDGVYDPEEKRRIIGNLYLDIKDKVSARLGLNDGEWILAQGTIYPDVLETAAKGEEAGGRRIKTHHNRVDAIMKLVEEGRIVEPVAPLYKDEVRRVGESLGLPRDAVWRHPFPGPGLGVRILCSDGSPVDDIPSDDIVKLREITSRAGYGSTVLPIRCTGNRGGVRTYTRPALITGQFDYDIIDKLVNEIIESVPSVNRIVYGLDTREPPSLYRLIKAHVTKQRLDRLRAIDDVVTDVMKSSGEYGGVWQMPVIILPLVNEGGFESVVLRPISSTDAMSAGVVRLKRGTLDVIMERKKSIGGVGDLFLDVTPKPPATIEWE